MNADIEKLDSYSESKLKCSILECSQVDNYNLCMNNR